MKILLLKYITYHIDFTTAQGSMEFSKYKAIHTLIFILPSV